MMNTLARKKLIHTAIARPGAGKTETLLANIPTLIGSGKQVVLALPTLVLADDIANRASSLNVPFRTIHNRDGEPVTPKLESALRETRNSLIICTQEAIRRIPHFLLRGWTLVIDELPKVVDYPDYLLKPTELGRVFDYTDERDGQLWIKDDLKSEVQQQVITNHADSAGKGCSTLGSSAANIFRLLLAEVDVFIDQPQADGKRHIRAVEEFRDWWDIFSSADETHVLAANVSGSEFERFADKVHGFSFTRSIFTPKPGTYSSTVTIHPLMPKGQIFSKRKMTEPCGHQRLIDFILEATLEHAASKPLLFANKWAELKEADGAQHVAKDCRGLNSYDKATDAILLFGGNPSPSEKKGLEYLKMRYGHDFEAAFITSRLLEPSLQAVTRTALRRSDNTHPIQLYVQDGRVAQYLVETYLPDALVDWSLSETMPIKPDGRRKKHPQHEQVMSLLSENVAIKAIARQTGTTVKTVRKWRDELLAA